MYVQRSERPFNFSWVLPGRLAALGEPFKRSHLRYLIVEGVTRLVTLSPECPPHPAASELLQCCHLPIEEFEPPTLQQTLQFIEFCRQAADQQQAVAVHCRAGRGRTGTLCACYLVAFCDLHPAEAVSRVRGLRPGSLETHAQERAVWELYDLVCRQRKDGDGAEARARGTPDS